MGGCYMSGLRWGCCPDDTVYWGHRCSGLLWLVSSHMLQECVLDLNVRQRHKCSVLN